MWTIWGPEAPGVKRTLIAVESPNRRDGDEKNLIIEEENGKKKSFY